jgi:hypothetical protein
MIKVRLDDVQPSVVKHLVARTLCLGHQLFVTIFHKTPRMSAFLRHWINSTSSHPNLSYSILVLFSFISQDFFMRFLYCSFSDKFCSHYSRLHVIKPRLVISCTHIPNTRHSEITHIMLTLPAYLCIFPSRSCFWWQALCFGGHGQQGADG